MTIITGTIDRIEEEKTVIKTQEGQELIIPQSLITDYHPGEVVTINISKENEQTSAKKAMAKEMLNQILETKQS